MISFPSEEFFLELKRLAERDPDRYRRLGTVDIVLVCKIDFGRRSEFYEISFSGYRCTGVRRLASPREAAPGAVILEGDADTWRAMVESIRHHGKADLGHTLNTLTLADDPMRVYADNQLDVDRFYRYQQSLQEFFDEGGVLQSTFVEPAPARA